MSDARGHEPHTLYVDELAAAEPSGNPLVVLVHGSMDRHRSFLRLRASLRDHDVVLYDRRGYHRSRHVQPPARGAADHADDLVTLLSGRRAVVLGHSYGGDVALTAAARSELVVGLVVYEPPLAWLRWWHPAGVSYRRAPFAGLEAGTAAEQFVRRMIGERRFERLGETARASLRADGPALVTELTALRLDGAPFDPQAVRIPTVVAYGSRSFVRHRQGAGWLGSHLPRPEVHVVEGAEHGAHISHPGELAGLVRHAARLVAAPEPPA